MKQPQVYFWIKVFGVIGLVLASYLLWQQLFHPAFQPCNINSFINCDAVVSGPVAKTFGIPTPLLGLVGYLAILTAAFLKKRKTVLAVSLGGLAFCLGIAYIELVQLKVICPVCILCQLDMLSVVILAVYLNKKPQEKS